MKTFRNIATIRSQIVFITVILLLIPLLVVLYDLLFATKSDEVMFAEKEERLSSVVSNQIVPALVLACEKELGDGASLHKLAIEDRVNLFRRAFDEVAGPLPPNFPGVRFGLYLPESQQIFVHGFLREYRELSPEEARQRERRIFTEADSGLAAVTASGRPLSKLTTSLNEQTIEYFAPVFIQDRLVAVVWADERLHPIFARSQNFRLLIRYLTLLVLFASAAGVLVLIHNLTKGVSLIKQGLRELEGDLTKKLPEMPGEAGEIARAVNKMASSLAEKEKLEEELRRSERLAALGRLVTGIAHELRNPLSVVRTTVQLMETAFPEAQGIDEYIRVIKEQVDRQNRIIQELLDFGRPGKNYLLPVDVNRLLEKVLTFTSPLLRENRVKLNLETSGQLPLIEADGEKIKQVFVNLILNSVAAMPGGGSLTIKTYAQNGRVCAEFKDTGCGIAPEDLPKIFDPFYTTRDEGTGLGLAISHQIIKSHGGTIEVTETGPRGTTFKIELPVLPELRQAAGEVG